MSWFLDFLSSINPLQGGQENQQVTIGQGIEHQVAEMDNAHVSENSKTSSSPSRDTVKPESTLGKDSRRATRKADPQHKHSPSTNTHAQNRTIAHENTNLKTQVEAARRNLAQATKQSEEKEKRIRGLVSEKEGLQTSIKIEREGVLREKAEAQKQIRELQRKIEKLEDELKSTKGILHGVQEKHSHTTKLLEERTVELKGAQTFLTTVDRYAGAEIMKMVEALNAEIFQGGAVISELLGDGMAISKIDRQRKDTKVTRGERDHLAQIVGPVLIEYLSTKPEQVQVNPFPLQLAVQAILTKWCVFMVNNFYVGPGRDNLKEVYKRIWESEPQAVAGRWRAMTMGQAKHLETTTTEKDNVIKILSTLLYLSGSPTANVTSQQTGLCLQQVASTIMNIGMQLRTAIQEGVTTTEMQVLGANASEVYQDAVMDDIYADAGYVQQPDIGKGPGHILCAVGMGLMRSGIRRNVEDGTRSIQSDITMKAKIVFPSILFDST